MPGNYEKHFSVLAELTADIEKETREVALEIDTRVVLATPVDTGRARANWTVSVGRPDTTQSESTDFASEMRKSQQTIVGAKGFNTIYIQNNLPYIIRLNEGWSMQAPTKYIDRILEQVKNDRK